MKSRHVLAWDLGTSGAKVGIVDVDGNVLANDFEPTELLLQDGGAEQSPADWWRALVTATNRLLAKNVVPRDTIAAMGVTAQWSGTVAVDAQGQPLWNAIIWMDSRGAGEVQKLMGGFPEVSGYALHKLWRWARLTGGAPTRAGKDPIAHILWLKAAQPEVFERTHKFLEPKDFLTYRLTGRMAASFDSIALHWVTDNRDANDVRYAQELLDAARIPREKLPDLMPASAVLGKLGREAAETFGLSQDVLVTTSAADVHSAAIGAGTTKSRAAHLYIGTSSWISCHVDQKQTDVLHNMAALPAAIPGRYLLLNEQETAGGCLTHLRDKLLFAPDELGSPAPDDFFAAFDRIAARSPSGSRKLMFLPWLYGERTPVEDHALRGGFINYSLEHERSDVFRSVLEGVALNVRWLFGHVEGFVGDRIDELRFIGGGADSALWCQILADVLGRPILKIKAPRLANLRGAAFIAHVALGSLRFDDVGERVAIEQRFEPTAAAGPVHDQQFAVFRELHRRNLPIFHRLNRRGK